MYEHPQYRTPEGFRRTKIQSLRKKLREQKLKKSGSLQQKNGTITVQSAALQRTTAPGTISKEAAKLIADTISLMLKDTR